MKMLKGSFQLESTPTDKPWGLSHLNLHCSSYKKARLVDTLAVNTDFPSHDEPLCLGPALNEAAINEQLVKAYFGEPRVHSSDSIPSLKTMTSKDCSSAESSSVTIFLICS